MNPKKIAGGFLILLFGTALGYVLGNAYEIDRLRAYLAKHLSLGVAGGDHPPPGAPDSASPPPGEPGVREVLYWYDPMYPDRHFDQPGKSPYMDMDLLPRYADPGGGAGIAIDPAQVQNMGVRTEKVTRGRLTFSQDIPANLEFNEYQLAKIQPRAMGFVEKTYSLAMGDLVKAGDPLADVTVPEWAADQSEYLLLKAQNAAPGIINGVRERLRISGMPEEMLAAVEATGKVQTRLTIASPLDGVITMFDAYPGMNADKNMTIATVQGVNPIWVAADVPERNLHLVAPGSRIRVTVSAYPDRAFYAESFTLLPKADHETRTVPLRLTLDNSEGLLKPGLTAGIRLRGTGEELPLVPTQAVIDLGDEQRVITVAADGSFVPRKIEVARASREQTAVSAGLEEGEYVVVSGLFLIDSEANLRGALDRMRRADSVPAAGSGKEGK
ncbi:MAG: efflux RND transporter periplasmic adaptor subunit [Planctomycetota bacterium]|jgi:Cu(I)/Ag(I) efflux system membrane fusion protein|nr:efflux RND transporter periplasmic adaptor subunit [Planctomycetota bacterium]